MASKFIAVLHSESGVMTDQALFKVKLTPQKDYQLDPESWASYAPRQINNDQVGYSFFHVRINDKHEIEPDKGDPEFYYCQPIELARANTSGDLVRILAEGPYRTNRIVAINDLPLHLIHESDYIGDKEQE